MIKWSLRIFGLGMAVFGIAAYFGASPWPIQCQSRWCHFITGFIPLEVAIAAFGLMLMLLARLMSRRN